VLRPLKDLGFATVREAGILFSTGKPVTLSFVHNTEKASRPMRGGVDVFQQKTEPAGFFMLTDDDPGRPLVRGWTRGDATFRFPLVLLWNTGSGGYDENSWKARLSRAYGDKRGRALTLALRRDGYDAVVTVRDGSTSEIVDLSRVR
jgi:hypothetical protein